MDRRPIPRTGITVPSLCLGTMTFGTPVGEAEAIALTHWALDHGIDFIDTANSYEGYSRVVGSAGGQAEVILGKALRGRRDRVVLASKVGMNIGPADTDRGLSRAHIERELERSLRRLQTDYLDLYYLHAPDAGTPLAETVATMDRLATEGRIRHWGVSNYSAEQLTALLAVCDTDGLRRPVAVQPPYSLLKRDIEADLLPLCRAEQLAVIPYQVLQGGLLTGKYRPAAPAPAGSRLAEKPQWIAPLDDDLFGQLAAIELGAGARGRTMLQHALQSLLEAPAVVSLIVGVKRIDQLEEMLTALEKGEGSA